MTSLKRTRRYFGLTAGQIALLIGVAVLNLAILGLGLALVVSPQTSTPVSLNTQSIFTTVPVARATTPASRFPATWTPTPASTATPTRTPSLTPTPTHTPTPTIEKPTIVGWENLASYRLQFKMRLGSEPETQYIQWKVVDEWVKQPRAMHTIISMAGTGLPGGISSTRVEAIVIGDKVWGRSDDVWQVMIYPEAQAMRGNWEGIEQAFHRLQPAGEETVNGVRCKHYMIDESMAGAFNFGFAQVNAHADGEVWLANEPDLPTIGIRLRVKLRTTNAYSTRSLSNLALPTPLPSQSAQSVFDLEYDVTNINTPIKIRPPAGFE